MQIAPPLQPETETRHRYGRPPRVIIQHTGPNRHQRRQAGFKLPTHCNRNKPAQARARRQKMKRHRRRQRKAGKRKQYP